MQVLQELTRSACQRDILLLSHAGPAVACPATGECRDDLQEFDVVTDNAGANISVGGVYMNMVTRSGTNQWHGDAAAYYLTSAFQSKMNFPVFDGNVDPIGTPFVMARDTTVDAGGTITGSTFVPSSDYELPTDMLNPRVMRIGLKFDF